MSELPRYQVRSFNGTGPLYIYDTQFDTYVASPETDRADFSLYCDHMNMVYNNARYWMIEAKHAIDQNERHMEYGEQMRKEKKRAIDIGRMMYDSVQPFRDKMSFEQYEPFNAFFETFIKNQK